MTHRIFAVAAAFLCLFSTSASFASKAGPDLTARIERISANFLGLPYLGDGPLGEGESGKYDRDPMFRFDGFDCTTYVETVLAAAMSRRMDEFQDKLRLIRYENGVVDFVTRNHFPDGDWIPNNIRAGFLTDITEEVALPGKVEVAQPLIDKAGWYAKMQVSAIKRPDLDEAARLELLVALQAEGSRFTPVEATVPYIPFELIFDPEVNEALLDKIPSGTIVSIVRPDWDIKDKLGTELSISHHGWIIRKADGLYLRHASLAAGKVAEQPLLDYLADVRKVPSIKGINLVKPL